MSWLKRGVKYRVNLVSRGWRIQDNLMLAVYAMIPYRLRKRSRILQKLADAIIRHTLITYKGLDPYSQPPLPEAP